MASASILPAVGLIIAAYLIGSVPFGLLLVKSFKAIDLRTVGSGNIGATNAARAGGWKIGVATLFADIVKGALPTGISLLIFDKSMLAGQFCISMTVLGAFLGHLYPVFLKFRTGGKGVATAAGCFLAASPAAGLAALAVFIGIVAVTKRVSAGSLAGAFTLPIGVSYFETGWVLSACALATALLVAYRHTDNIRRLIAGTEPKLGDKL